MLQERDISIIIIFNMFIWTSYLVWRLWGKLQDVGFDEFQCGQTRAVWNVAGLKHALKNRVLGQEGAVSEVVQLLRRATENPLRAQPVPQPRRQVVFLLGGPGVGKSLVLDILTKHVKIETLEGVQDVKYITKHMKGEIVGKQTVIKNAENISGTVISIIELDICVDFYIKQKKDFSLAELLMESVSDDENLRPSSFDRSIIFVTVPTVSERALEKLLSVTKYEEHMNTVANDLDDYMTCHAPNLHVSFVTFNPLGFETFEEIVRAQRLNQRALSVLEEHSENEVDFDEDDILPRGCKTDHKDLEKLLQ